MSPDFEYFLRLNIKSCYSHTLLGVFWFDLPISLLVAFIFHLAIRKKIISNLPTFLQSRLNPFYSFNWLMHLKRNWVAVFLSIVIGAYSHLLWDSFTHKTGYFVSLLPLLSTKSEFFYFSIINYKLLQHLSTIVGAFFIMRFISKLSKSKNDIYQINLSFWIIVIAFICLFIFLNIMEHTTKLNIGNLIVSSISGCWIGLIFASILTQKAND